MSPKSHKIFVKLFAEEMLQCVLSDSNIPWDPRWGIQTEICELLPDLNVCRGLLSESVATASRRFRPLVMCEGSYIWDGVVKSSDTGLLLPSLLAVGYQLGHLNDSFFIFMAVVNDLCVRFHRHSHSHLIVNILEAVTLIMREMAVHTPKLLRKKALDFLEEMAKVNT